MVGSNWLLQGQGCTLSLLSPLLCTLSLVLYYALVPPACRARYIHGYSTLCHTMFSINDLCGGNIGPTVHTIDYGTSLPAYTSTSRNRVDRPAFRSSMADLLQQLSATKQQPPQCEILLHPPPAKRARFDLQIRAMPELPCSRSSSLADPKHPPPAPCQAPPSNELPADWRAHTCSSSGNRYYYNIYTRQTSWERPYSSKKTAYKAPTGYITPRITHRKLQGPPAPCIEELQIQGSKTLGHLINQMIGGSTKTSVCVHGRRKTQCKDCGTGYCKHKRQKYQCRDCGTGHCPHGHRLQDRINCKVCHPSVTVRQGQRE